LLRDVECCGEDLWVGSAAAEIAAYGVLHVVEIWVWIALQQGGAAHNHAGSAKAALHGVVLDEGSLHLMHGVAVGEALDGCDLAAYRVDGECHAGESRGVVDPDRAGGAGAAVAYDFCAGETEVVAERFGEGVAGFDGDGMLVSIDVQFDGESVWPQRLVGV